MNIFIKAHEHSSFNREEIMKSSMCLCFYCCQIFPSIEVKKFGNRGTALCPKCEIDSVIGDAAGFDCTLQFSQDMCKYWFQSYVF